MTKKEKQYLQEREAALYLDYVEFKSAFGMDDPSTLNSLARWGTVSKILDELGIEVNQQLPDNRKAFEIQVGS